jgi:NAD(P)-dependent dehydrogenase (short-subunit alcohol dehydrogenase family)
MRKKVCLITGGLGFLGSKFCSFFSSINFEVICIDINKSKTKKFKKNIYFYQCDITNEKQVSKLYKKLRNKNIQVLINNAAIDAIPKVIQKTNMKYPSIDAWWKEINVSLIGSFLMIKYFGENMFKNKNGSIINIGSDLSIIAPNQKIYKSSYKNYKKPPTYSVIKHGLLGLTRYYASLYAEKNVRVNMVSPGPVKNKQNNLLLTEIKKLTPMNRLNNPEDLFGVLEFLSGNYSKFITGQNIVIDGGKTLI